MHCTFGKADFIFVYGFVNLKLKLLILSVLKCVDIIKRNFNFLLSQEAQDTVADQGWPSDRRDLLSDVSLPGLHRDRLLRRYVQ